MHIHHLNCLSLCPPGGRLMDDGPEPVTRRGRLVCHCLLVETGDTLALIDTGLGWHDVAYPKKRLSPFFLRLLKPELREDLTAVHQLDAMGIHANDIGHIVLTHLDFDHVGGLDDFAQATVHLHGIEYNYALLRRTWLDRQRYRPQQWSSQERWQTYSLLEGERWFGLPRLEPLQGLPEDIVLVALPGHTPGHVGVALQQGGRWLLHAGDAYFFHEEMNLDQPYCTPGLHFYQWLMEIDRDSRLQSQAQLRELRRLHGDEVEIFCSHDQVEFERLARHEAQVPEDLLIRQVPEGLLPVEARSRRV